MGKRTRGEGCDVKANRNRRRRRDRVRIIERAGTNTGMVTGGTEGRIRLFHLGPGNSYRSAEDLLGRQTGIFVVGQKSLVLPKCSITPK